MRYLPALLLLLFPGCADYTAVQMRLVEQAQRGITLTDESLQLRTQLIEQLHTLQRKRLDEAFDADVRERDELSAEWVIKHRRAYAAGVEALSAQREASRRAAETDRQNLAAVQQALRQLYWLQSLQMRWSLPNLLQEKP
jgi:hypothetical protein